ncbi:MAG: glycosyltransferase [Anaerolineaceae bacterium]|nr:MAG: glycosyltransferase [Anaerolineaceae bacterium]
MKVQVLPKGSANTKLRIAIVTSIHPDFDFRVWKYATSLTRAGQEIHLICPWNLEEGSLIEGVKMLTFSRVENRFLRIFLVPYRVLKTLLPIIRQVDIIHFHDIDLLPLMAIVSLVKPVVYDVHENYADEMLVRNWIPRFLRWPLYWYVRFIQIIFPLILRNIVLVVPYQDHEFNNNRLNKIQIMNFASLRLLEDFKDNYMKRDSQILFSGSHYEENGSMLLLDITEEMKRRCVKAQVVATDRFSSRRYREQFEAEIKRRDLTNIRIVHCVPSDRIMSILNEATVAVLTDLRVPKAIKGIPTRLFEYMAAGLPVVASDLEILVDIISDKQCGLLARPEDPGMFVDAIEKLVNEKDFAYSLGLNGQNAFRRNFSWESQIPDLLKFYAGIITQ